MHVHKDNEDDASGGSKDLSAMVSMRQRESARTLDICTVFCFSLDNS